MMDMLPGLDEYPKTAFQIGHQHGHHSNHFGTAFHTDVFIFSDILYLADSKISHRT
jgi:hypothetical protein